MSLQPSETTDKVISVVLILLLVISVLGNTTAFFYFWKNRRKSLPNKLYMAIIVVDLVTNLSSVPVITSLFNLREPMLFETSGLCVTYLISMNFSIRMSMFLVAVLSITRTISIVTPHRARNISSKMIALSIFCYGVLLVGVDGLLTAKEWFSTRFYPPMPACVFVLSELNKLPIGTMMALFLLSVVIEALVPPVVVFTSLVITVVALKRSVPRSNSDTESRLRQISITVALFTALHMICTLPFFTYVFSQAVDHFTSIPEFSWFRSGDMMWYGQISFLLLPSCLNTALNPCLYFWRMPRFRENIWISMCSAYRGAVESWDRHVQRVSSWVISRGRLTTRETR